LSTQILLKVLYSVVSGCNTRWRTINTWESDSPSKSYTLFLIPTVITIRRNTYLESDSPQSPILVSNENKEQQQTHLLILVQILPQSPILLVTNNVYQIQHCNIRLRFFIKVLYFLVVNSINIVHHNILFSPDSPSKAYTLSSKQQNHSNSLRIQYYQILLKVLYSE
jgi:hypothetical protein